MKRIVINKNTITVAANGIISPADALELLTVSIITAINTGKKKQTLHFNTLHTLL